MRKYRITRKGGRSEGESVFISMTDMTVSFLFIVMILLAFFASKYSDDSSVSLVHHNKVVDHKDDEIEILQNSLLTKRARITALNEKVEEREEQIKQYVKKISDYERQIAQLQAVDPLEQYMLRASAARLMLLEKLQGRLKTHFPNLPVEVIPEEGALRFQGEGLFDTNSDQLDAEKVEVIKSLAETLDGLLPCFTFSSDETTRWDFDCNPGYSVIEALQIEGHTDSTGEDLYNLSLSTNRAINTFSTMLANSPQLINWLNLRDQPVISVAGYGKMRPVATNKTEEGRATNRRIDVRIIMYAPASQEEVSEIENRLEGVLSGE